MIRLLQAVKIPAGYKKMVHGTVSSQHDKLLLFTPRLEEARLCMADGLVEVGDGSCVTLIMENRGFEPILLKEGMELGETTMVEVLNSSDVVGEGNGDTTTSQEEGSVCTLVSGNGPKSDRVQKLFSQSGRYGDRDAGASYNRAINESLVKPNNFSSEEGRWAMFLHISAWTTGS